MKEGRGRGRGLCYDIIWGIVCVLFYFGDVLGVR